MQNTVCCTSLWFSVFFKALHFFFMVFTNTADNVTKQNMYNVHNKVVLIWMMDFFRGEVKYASRKGRVLGRVVSQEHRKFKKVVSSEGS